MKLLTITLAVFLLHAFAYTDKEWEQCFLAKESVDLHLYNAHSIGLGYKQVGGVTTEQLALIIMVETKGNTQTTIPSKIGGCITDVIESPLFENQQSLQSLTRTQDTAVIQPAAANPPASDCIGVPTKCK